MNFKIVAVKSGDFLEHLHSNATSLDSLRLPQFNSTVLDLLKECLHIEGSKELRLHGSTVPLLIQSHSPHDCLEQIHDLDTMVLTSAENLYSFMDTLIENDPNGFFKRLTCTHTYTNDTFTLTGLHYEGTFNVSSPSGKVKPLSIGFSAISQNHFKEEDYVDCWAKSLVLQFTKNTSEFKLKCSLTYTDSNSPRDEDSAIKKALKHHFSKRFEPPKTRNPKLAFRAALAEMKEYKVVDKESENTLIESYKLNIDIEKNSPVLHQRLKSLFKYKFNHNSDAFIEFGGYLLRRLHSPLSHEDLFIATQDCIVNTLSQYRYQTFSIEDINTKLTRSLQQATAHYDDTESQTTQDDTLTITTETDFSIEISDTHSTHTNRVIEKSIQASLHHAPNNLVFTYNILTRIQSLRKNHAESLKQWFVQSQLWEASYIENTQSQTPLPLYELAQSLGLWNTLLSHSSDTCREAMFMEQRDNITTLQSTPMTSEDIELYIDTHSLKTFVRSQNITGLLDQIGKLDKDAPLETVQQTLNQIKILERLLGNNANIIKTLHMRLQSYLKAHSTSFSHIIQILNLHRFFPTTLTHTLKQETLITPLLEHPEWILNSTLWDILNEVSDTTLYQDTFNAILESATHTKHLRYCCMALPQHLQAKAMRSVCTKRNDLVTTKLSRLIATQLFDHDLKENTKHFLWYLSQLRNLTKVSTSEKIRLITIEAARYHRLAKPFTKTELEDMATLASQEPLFSIINLIENETEDNQANGIDQLEILLPFINTQTKTEWATFIYQWKSERKQDITAHTQTCLTRHIQRNVSDNHRELTRYLDHPVLSKTLWDAFLHNTLSANDTFDLLDAVEQSPFKPKKFHKESTEKLLSTLASSDNLDEHDHIYRRCVKLALNLGILTTNIKTHLDILLMLLNHYKLPITLYGKAITDLGQRLPNFSAETLSNMIAHSSWETQKHETIIELYKLLIQSSAFANFYLRSQAFLVDLLMIERTLSASQFKRIIDTLDNKTKSDDMSEPVKNHWKSCRAHLPHIRNQKLSPKKIHDLYNKKGPRELISWADKNKELSNLIVLLGTMKDRGLTIFKSLLDNLNDHVWYRGTTTDLRCLLVSSSHYDIFDALLTHNPSLAQEKREPLTNPLIAYVLLHPDLRFTKRLIETKHVKLSQKYTLDINQLDGFNSLKAAFLEKKLIIENCTPLSQTEVMSRCFTDTLSPTHIKEKADILFLNTGNETRILLLYLLGILSSVYILSTLGFFFSQKFRTS